MNIADKVKNLSESIRRCKEEMISLDLRKARLDERKESLLVTLRGMGIGSADEAYKKLVLKKEDLAKKEAEVVVIDETLQELMKNKDKER